MLRKDYTQDRREGQSLEAARDVCSQGEQAWEQNIKSLDRVLAKATELQVSYGHDFGWYTLQTDIESHKIHARYLSFCFHPFDNLEEEVSVWYQCVFNT